MGQLPDPLEHRHADHSIETLFLQRWSPRAMSGAAIKQGDLLRLFEAARWAPSTYNEQEWRFLYAHRDTPQWPVFLQLLVEANRGWCGQAGVLIVLISRKDFARNGKPNPVHTLDTGAAMQNLALQAAAMHLVAHPMAGFDRDEARRQLSVPENYAVEAMIAVGHPGDPEQLPESLRSREVPTGRKPVAEFVCEGPFAFGE